MSKAWGDSWGNSWGSAWGTSTPAAVETDKSAGNNLANDYRNPTLKKQASTTRLYLRQRREAKKTRVRKDAPKEWITRQINSNAMRAALLASS